MSDPHAPHTASVYAGGTNSVSEIKPLVAEVEMSLCIGDDVLLPDAVQQLTKCGPAFTMFVTDSSGAVLGVLTGGDILRYLSKPENTRGWASASAKMAMTPRRERLRDGRDDPTGMFFVVDRGSGTWYAQISARREADDALPKEGDRRWQRIKLVPVLDRDFKLVDVLDIGSPRPRARLESLVMAKAFRLDKKLITNAAVNQRRKDFDDIHYGTQFKKIHGLCEVLRENFGGDSVMLDDVFEKARADELWHALGRAEEWLKEHVPDADINIDESKAKGERKATLKQVAALRARLSQKYLQESQSTYFPASADDKACATPQVVIVLGCKDEDLQDKRVRAAYDVVEHMVSRGEKPVLVLSGGGSAHNTTEARLMLDKLSTFGVTITADDKPPTLPVTRYRLKFAWGDPIDVLLEEDSLDTLGNAVFSWFHLKIDGRFVMETLRDGTSRDANAESANAANPLERLLIVTDRIHAPRSHDIFRRIFAFRGQPSKLRLAVKTVEQERTDDASTALEHLKSESQTNGEVFRLVNLMTNGYDVIGDGHGRSILGQMLRLHKVYKARWDLVRKYRSAWSKRECV